MAQLIRAPRSKVEVVAKFILNNLVAIFGDPILKLDRLNPMSMNMTSISTFEPSIKSPNFMPFF